MVLCCENGPVGMTIEERKVSHTKGAFRFAKFLVMAARPGFWLTAVWFYLLPCGGAWVFDKPLFWLGLVYVTFPLGVLIYGLNDLFDYETDRLNPRKGTYLFGARGEKDDLARLPWATVFVQAPFWIMFLVAEGLKFLLWAAVLVALTAVYNFPRWRFKSRPVLDMLNQAGYLLVFVLSSWLARLPQLPWPSFVFGLLFAMHSHLLGQIMDVEPDKAAGRRSTAVVFGAVPAKCLLAAFLLLEGGLLAFALNQRWIGGIFALGAIYFLADAFVLWKAKPYSALMMRLYLIGWNGIALATIPYVWRARIFVPQG